MEFRLRINEFVYAFAAAVQLFFNFFKNELMIDFYRTIERQSQILLKQSTKMNGKSKSINLEMNRLISIGMEKNCFYNHLNFVID